MGLKFLNKGDALIVDYGLKRVTLRYEIRDLPITPESDPYGWGVSTFRLYSWFTQYDTFSKSTVYYFVHKRDAVMFLLRWA